MTNVLPWYAGLVVWIIIMGVGSRYSGSGHA
ncbi:hypothetical protein ACVWZV_009507 [Bradyrhizobium sp. GM5.1]